MRDIADGGRRLATLLGNILEFARADEGTQRLYLAPVPLDAIATAAVERRRAAAAAQRVELVLFEVPVTVQADEDRMTGILCELIDNALAATSSGGRIEVSVARGPDGEAVLRVRDDGVGIAEADLPFVFEPFRRAAGAARSEGVGLGLATCERIVRLHGGRLALASAAQAGTTVTITLPMVR